VSYNTCRRQDCNDVRRSYEEKDFVPVLGGGMVLLRKKNNPQQAACEIRKG